MKRLGETGEKSEGNQKQIFSEDWRRNFNIGTKSNFRTFELKKKFRVFPNILCPFIINLKKYFYFR
jgi:hypothetical protein